jgi:type IV secretory pathway VirB4 component
VRCDYQHWEGALTTAPLGHDLLRYLNETDSPTLARLFPSSPALLRGGQGTPILYGLRVEGHGGSDTSSGTPILVDRFAVASPHEAVIAATGGGKTYYISWRLLQRFAHGHCAIVVIDPKDQEYRHLIESILGGTYLVLSEQAKVHLNPLALPPRSAATDERIRALQIDVRAERAVLLKQIVVGEAQARGIPR